MRRLLNTLYITMENAYLHAKGETLVVRADGVKEFIQLESIVIFGYVGVSPEAMHLCVDNGISLVFLTPSGKQMIAAIFGLWRARESASFKGVRGNRSFVPVLPTC